MFDGIQKLPQVWVKKVRNVWLVFKSYLKFGYRKREMFGWYSKVTPSLGIESEKCLVGIQKLPQVWVLESEKCLVGIQKLPQVWV